MKLRKALKATIVIITILLMDALIFINTAEAISPEKYNLEAIGGASTLLKYKGEPITSFYVGYAGKLYNYPAYCLDKNKKFVTKELSYTVTENGEITDVMLWRYIVNGYPYKKLSELGCKERNEAYVATQQAIYVYLYNQKIEDYEAIGEAGKRTLEAMKLIIENAKNTEETPASKAIEIKSADKTFKEDNIDKNYISKTYEVKSTLPMKSYKIKVQIKNHKTQEISDKIDYKITDINNKTKTEFKEDEKFKILIPEEIEYEEIDIKIEIEATIESKPIIYAIPNDELYQDFAIPGETKEEIIKETVEEEPEEDISTPENKKDEVPKINKEKKLPVTGM